MSADLTPAEAELLAAVANEDVTWRRRDGLRGPTTVSYRRWTSEDEYVLVTKVAKRLVAKRLVHQEMAAGYTFVGRGPLVLTAEGRRALAARSYRVAPSGPLQEDE